MKHKFKSIICNISYSLNLPQYLEFLNRNKIIVLMYHRVLNAYSENPLKNIFGASISINQFNQQMAYLASHCNVISSSMAFSNENISKNKKNVIITFDDGYKTNFTNVYPVLLKYNLPALFAIPTAFVVNKIPLWFDIIEYAINHTKKKKVKIKWEDNFLYFDLETIHDKSKFFLWLHPKCNQISQENRDHFINNVLRELDVSINSKKIFQDPDYMPLTSEEIKIMSESKIAEFASHSINHYALSRVNMSTLKNELVNSKLDIERLTGLRCNLFCIPGGFYNSSFINALLEAGYEKAFSSDFNELDPMNPSTVIGRYTITRSIDKGLFVDFIHGPFHRIYFPLKYKIGNSRRKQTTK